MKKEELNITEEDIRRKLLSRYIPDQKHRIPEVPDEPKSMGFFDFQGINEDRAKAMFPETMTTPEERKIVLNYMHFSNVGPRYRGYADCRCCGIRLGSTDMITPDGKWIYPQQWDHYITDHNLHPPREFVDDAIAWDNLEG